MSRETVGERPGWVLPLITFVIGLLVGWLVIGWGVWPVTWKNTLPPDLRAAERDDYLLMTAESYAATQDAEQARARVETWPAAQLNDDLARLQQRLANEDPARVGEVASLAAALGAQGVAGPAPAAPPPAPATGLGATLRGLCPGALYVLLVLIGIALVLWLWRQWRTAHEPRPASTRPPYRAPEHDVVSPERSDSQTGQTWLESGERALHQTAEPSELDTSIFQAPQPAAAVSKPAPQVAAAAGAASQRPKAVTPADQRAPGPVRATTELVNVGTFQAVYQLGEADYDEAFDIKDPSSGHIGQCGLALTDPIGRGHDQAAALQAWLWDTNDPNTTVKILMSEGAYRDTALRDQLAGEQPAIPVRLGTEFELESYNLLMRGKVEKLEYAQQEPAYGIFAELLVRLEVYRKM
jgi:hypothetical protein